MFIIQSIIACRIQLKYQYWNNNQFIIEFDIVDSKLNNELSSKIRWIKRNLLEAFLISIYVTWLTNQIGWNNEQNVDDYETHVQFIFLVQYSCECTLCILYIFLFHCIVNHLIEKWLQLLLHVLYYPHLKFYYFINISSKLKFEKKKCWKWH